jgi:hypothetical protein
MSTLLDAWQAALTAEQQAVYGYGLLGPYLTTVADRDRARADMAAHQATSNAIVADMVERHHTPEDPPAEYPDLYPVSAGAPALRLAVRLEDDTASAWRYLYAVASVTDGSSATALRRSAQANLISSAVRAAQWRRRVKPTAATVPFPGI